MITGFEETVTVAVADAEQLPLLAVNVNVSVAVKAVVAVLMLVGLTRLVGLVQAYVKEALVGEKRYILPLAGMVVLASFAVAVLTVLALNVRLWKLVAPPVIPPDALVAVPMVP